MSERRSTGVTIKGYTILDGDGVWGVQPSYYDNGRDRNMAGIVFWNELAQEWRVCEDSFANHYTARDNPEELGYPLAKLQKVIVYPPPLEETAS